MKKDKKKLLRSFEKAFRLSEAKDLLSPRWLKENQEPRAPHSTGFCYIAAEAAYHILKKEGPTAVCASYEEENGEHSTHWWIIIDDKKFDPTKSQYTKLGEKPPYHLGVRKGFLTKKPSKRAKKLMALVKEAYENW